MDAPAALGLRGALLALVAVVAACASGGPRVELDRYRGVYTTHFDGLPDRAAVCALLTNRGETPIEWVRLRLESRSELGDEPGRWRSSWIWRGRLEPGHSVALELRDPPVGEQIRLDLRGAGQGPVPAGGRRARRARTCSEQALRARLEREDAGRTASGRSLRAAVREGDGVGDDDVLVAEGEAAERGGARDAH